MLLRCGTRTLDLSQPVVMGVLNVTPDSFSDGGQFLDLKSALAHARRMEEEGAALIDVGGESTRPGSHAPSAEEEIRRVVPVIEALASRSKLPVSVDTSKPEVIVAAIRAGASMVNDVRALREPGALAAVADANVAVCLMHMQGEPRTMQQDPRYTDLVAEVREFLSERVRACQEAGIVRDRLVLDPGIGFGKRLEHNLALLAALPSLGALGLPLLIGASRKSMFATLLGRQVDERLAGSIAVATAAALGGASILRAHDVAQTVDALKVADALRHAGYKMNSQVGD